MTSTAETTRAADNTHTLTMSRKFPVPAQRLFDAGAFPNRPVAGWDHARLTAGSMPWTFAKAADTKSS